MTDTNTHVAYLSIGQVAAIFGVTVGTVRNWERAGKLRAIRTPGNQRRFAEAEIESVLAQEPWEPSS